MSWHFPDRRDGTVIACLTDTHWGYRNWTTEQLERVGRDIDDLAPWLDGIVHAGDGIHWSGTGGPNEDAEFITWINQRFSSNNLPWTFVPGNHDLSSFGSPGSAQAGASRSGQQWAIDYGHAGLNTIQQIGNVNVIGIGPDEWDYGANGNSYGPLVLPLATVNWLETQLNNSVLPCWIVCHVPLVVQYSGQLDAPTKLDTVLANPKVIGWISGHRHHDVKLAGTGNSGVYNFGGHEIFGINCPSVGGHTGGSLTEVPYDDTVISTFITIYDDYPNRVDIRWRDHLNRRWTRDSVPSFVRTHTRT